VKITVGYVSQTIVASLLSSSPPYGGKYTPSTQIAVTFTLSLPSSLFNTYAALSVYISDRLLPNRLFLVIYKANAGGTDVVQQLGA